MIENQNIWYKCDKCRKRFSVVYTSWNPTIIHVECGGTARMEDLNPKKGEKRKLGVKRTVDVTGFGRDERGKLVAISKDGKRVDPKDTMYDLQHDEHGWEATGHKVKGKQKR